VTEAKRPPGTSPRTTDRSAYLVRFRPNVSSERYREVSLAVREAPRPERVEGADDRDSAQVVDVSPRSVLVPSAPGFRTATLWSAWGASTVDEFRGRFDDDVELIEPDFTVTAFQQPAWNSFQQPAYVAAPRRDTQCAYSQANLMPGQWNLDRVDGAAGRALDGYFAPPECLCGKNVFIYVLDTGARTTHEDFKPASRCAAGWNFVGDACGGIVNDQSGHGTHVAATALGATSGVAKCANLVPVQILDGAGQGKGSYILSALDWVAEQDVGPGGRKIVSMSVGGPRSAVIDAAVREIVSSGIVVVAAAGNDGKDADGKFIF
jgi:subtilisin family serine protease